MWFVMLMRKFWMFFSDGSSPCGHLCSGPFGNKIPLPIMKSVTGFNHSFMVWGSVGSLLNFLTPRTTAAHWPSSRDKGMFRIFCLNIHGTHGVESNFAYYRMITHLAFCLPILLQCYFQTGFAGSSLLHLLNHFKRYWSLFHPKWAPI